MYTRPAALPELQAFWGAFQVRFRRPEGREALERYTTGLLTELPTKKGDTIAQAVPIMGITPTSCRAWKRGKNRMWSQYAPTSRCVWGAHGGYRIITTRGRKTEQLHRTEIWFHTIDGHVYITATPGRRDWYANMLAYHEFTLHLKQSTKASLARPSHAHPGYSQTACAHRQY